MQCCLSRYADENYADFDTELDVCNHFIIPSNRVLIIISPFNTFNNWIADIVGDLFKE